MDLQLCLLFVKIMVIQVTRPRTQVKEFTVRGLEAWEMNLKRVAEIMSLKQISTLLKPLNLNNGIFFLT